MKRALLMLTGLLALLTSAAGDPLPVGAAAPDVSGTTDSGAKLNLGDVYQSNRYTLVYFYPKADTPGCTAQGCSLRDAYAALADRGVAVIGVSTDDVAAQRAFKKKYDLPFTLIADTDKSVMKAFGQNANRPVASRQAYLVHDGRIVYADHKGSTSQQAQDILGFLAKGN
jgi:thioredoxin-dependent peroxiredoxin